MSPKAPLLCAKKAMTTGADTLNVASCCGVAPLAQQQPPYKPNGATSQHDAGCCVAGSVFLAYDTAVSITSLTDLPPASPVSITTGTHTVSPWLHHPGSSVLLPLPPAAVFARTCDSPLSLNRSISPCNGASGPVALRLRRLRTDLITSHHETEPGSRSVSRWRVWGSMRNADLIHMEWSSGATFVLNRRFSTSNLPF